MPSAVLIAMTMFAAPPAHAQNRGVYPLGMSALNSGVTPEPGFSFGNQLLFYSRDQQRGADGEVVQTGSQSVILAMNAFVWVAKARVFGGARFSMSATLPLTNNALSGDTAGAISGGGGFADSYYQPFILGWQRERLAIRAVYGFLAPTGSFDPQSKSNSGSGYWTHAFSSGQTWSLIKDHQVTVSAFQMYEVHTEQHATGTRAGDTLSLDYSGMKTFVLPREARLQLGAGGYGQWQTTATRGPAISEEQTASRYRVNAAGFVSGIAWPGRGAALGFKYFREFANRSTYEGYSTQITGSISF